MKTLEETKKGLECCQHDQYSGLCQCDKGCPYRLADKCDHLRRDALAHIQQLEAAQPKWISVEERLPEPETEVLVWLRHVPNIAIYGHDKYGNLDFYYIDECGYRGTFRPAVTHWMPLPEPPKEG